MLLSKERSAYSTGLDTLYFSATPSGDINIPLTLNGNTFSGVKGLKEGDDYTFNASDATLTLKRNYVREKYNAVTGDGLFDTLILQFNKGLEWEMFLNKTSDPASAEATGTKTAGISIPINYRGKHIHRISAFEGAAPEGDKLDGLVFPRKPYVGGNHTDWFPYLEYGNAYTINYSAGTLTLMGKPNSTSDRGFFSSTVKDGVNVLVIEFLDGTRLDIELTVAGNNVTAKAAGGPPPYEKPEVTTPVTTTPATTVSGTTVSGTTASGTTATTAPTTTVSGATTVTTAPVESDYKLGDIFNTGEPTIAGVLEILKHLAGMKSALDNEKAYKAACITGEKPVIADVLEMLKFLANMDCILKEIYK
jgi:endoglucanase